MSNRENSGHLFNSTRLRTSLKMSLSKLQFLQEKKSAMSKQQRRQLADVLSKGKETSARIRVENIIRNDIYIELLEFLELYCDLLLARIGLISDHTVTSCDPGLEEAVKSIIFAAPHTELKELLQIRELLIFKYGVDFGKTASSNLDNKVPEKITSRCSVTPPSEELVDLYLCEIAKAYEVPYSGLKVAVIDDIAASDTGSDNEGGLKEAILENPLEETNGTENSPKNETNPVKVPSKSKAKIEQEEFDSLKARFAALKNAKP